MSFGTCCFESSTDDVLGIQIWSSGRNGPKLCRRGMSAPSGVFPKCFHGLPLKNTRKVISIHLSLREYTDHLEPILEVIWGSKCVAGVWSKCEKERRIKAGERNNGERCWEDGVGDQPVVHRPVKVEHLKRWQHHKICRKSFFFLF